MSDNPIARVRLLGNISIVAVVIVSISGLFLTGTYWNGWPWLVGAVAIGYAALSFTAHLHYSDKVDAAWDEQNIAAHRTSLAFGYWATLAVFLLLLCAVLTDLMHAGRAFFWLGPVLGIAPAVNYLTSVARGRAE